MVANPNIASLGLGGDPIPREGQRVIGPFLYDFSQAQTYAQNLRAQMENLSLMSFAMAAYIDNSQNSNIVTLNFAGQVITVRGGTQGWYPVISQRPIQFTISCAAASGVTNLFFSNFHVPGFQWSAVPTGVVNTQTPWTQNINAAGFALSNIPSITGNGALALASGGAAPVTINGGLEVTGGIDNTGGSGITFPDGTKQVTAAVGTGGQTPWLQNVNAGGFTLSNIPTITGTGALTLNPGGAGAVVAGGLLQVAAAGIKFSDNSIQTSAATAGAPQTPWASNIDAGGFTLSNIPTIKGQAALTLGAGGAGSVILQTSARARLTFDSAGHGTIATPDDAGTALSVSATQNIATFTGAANPRLQIVDTNTGGQICLAVASGAGSYLTGAAAGDVLIYNNNISSGLELGTNGRTRLLIDTNGNVGIGTTTPAVPMDVAGSIRSTSQNTPAAGSGPGLELFYNASGQGVVLAFDRTAGVGRPLSVVGAPLTLNGAGGANVGVATAAPACALDVAGSMRSTGQLVPTSGAGVEVQYNVAAGTGNISCYDRTAAAWKALQINGSPLNLNQTGGGFVGINNANPQYQLDVAGGARVSAGLETGLTYGLSCNLYNNGANWVYRAAGAGCLLLADPANIVLYTVVAGTAGTAAALTAALVINGTKSFQSQIPFLMNSLPPPGNAAEANLANLGGMLCLASNTSLVFRVRGSDGVIRQAALTLA
jgi:hypothetical protein